MVVGGEGCCPTMDLLRSEPMQLVQLIIPMESAHRTISYLGDLGLFQFKDVSIKQTHLIHIWICNVPISLHIWLFVWVIRFSCMFYSWMKSWIRVWFYVFHALYSNFDFDHCFFLRYYNIFHSWKAELDTGFFILIRQIISFLVFNLDISCLIIRTKFRFSKITYQ